MQLPAEIIIKILKRKWLNFRRVYLAYKLCMPILEDFQEPFCIKNTIDFAWFTYKHPNPYYIRHYAFRDKTYFVNNDGSADLAYFSVGHRNDVHYTIFD